MQCGLKFQAQRQFPKKEALNRTDLTVPACKLCTACNILHPNNPQGFPFKEHDHEKATGFGPRFIVQPAIDGC